MAVQRPSIPKGTRDFSPEEMAKRNYIFNTIRSVYELYGFRCIETPAMEQLSTLMGKYGDEGDKLLFKILNSGDYLAPLSDEQLLSRQSARLTGQLCEKGLRYDLTVPFARYVVMHRGELSFPFKRYQIQPVWRADRPQKGRYREFYQCDADVVGSDSLMNEVELLQIIDEVFRRLGIRISVKLNNRKILSGIAEILDEQEHLVEITVAIDKLEKIGLDKVNEELAANGVKAQAIAKLQPILALSGDNTAKLEALKTILASSQDGMKGIEELEYILGVVSALPLRCQLEIDLSLARGLNYYTGTIIEVKALDVAMGSITGGGRYDNLTGVFGLPGVSGVGISFGADRIFDVLNQLDLYPASSLSRTEVLFANFGEREVRYCLPLAAALRQAGIRTEVYPDAGKLKKQFAYADDHQIALMAIAGENEINEQKIQIKNMQTGQQESIAKDDLVAYVKGLLSA
ncbi:MAG: histidine--tRNA ligase [Bacteroidales bacterium]|nr:histidine--tRNA ligase [Bacteroidales bacterium]